MTVRKLRTTAITIACLGGLLGTQSLAAEEAPMRWPDAGPDAVPFEDVEFTFSSDPTVTVLSLVTITGRTVRETLIYGNGRVELQKSNLWGPLEDLKTTVLEAHELVISYDEVAALMRLAVIYGLVESDTDTLEANRKALGTRQIRSESTSYRVTVALETYRRGPISRENVENAVRVDNAPFMATQYPEVLEYAGFREINTVLRNTWKRARAEETNQ